MKLTIDTDLGVAFTSVYNYVEGGNNEIAVCLPQFTDHSSHFIAEMFEETIEYVKGNLHALYAVVDELKGKELRKHIHHARLKLETDLALAESCLPYELDIIEHREDLRGQLGVIDDLLEMKKNSRKASLKLLTVEIIPDRTAFYACFGVPELSLPLVVILVDQTV